MKTKAAMRLHVLVKMGKNKRTAAVALPQQLTRTRYNELSLYSVQFI